MTGTQDLLAVRRWAVSLPYLREIQAGNVQPAETLWAARNRTRKADEIAIVPIMGLITQRGGFFGASIEQTRASLREAERDGADGIVLEIDSPGGVVYGVQELAADIREMRERIPVVASINSVGTSAAYHLAAQASEVFVTESGETGSVGVFGVHEDWSAALNEMGVVVTLISEGEGKVAGNPFEPLSDEARADIEADVRRYYDMFVGAVSRGRPVPESTIREDWGAWVYGAARAKTKGLADRVGTLDEAIRAASRLSSERRAINASIAREGERKRARARGLTG